MKDYPITPHGCGSPNYMPLPSFYGEFTFQRDWYAALIVAWELLTGKHPFPEIEEMFRSYEQGSKTDFIQNMRTFLKEVTLSDLECRFAEQDTRSCPPRISKALTRAIHELTPPTIIDFYNASKIELLSSKAA